MQPTTYEMDNNVRREKGDSSCGGGMLFNVFKLKAKGIIFEVSLRSEATESRVVCGGGFLDHHDD
jgi:hypothetical protein